MSQLHYTFKKRIFKEHNYKSLYINGKTLRMFIDPKKPITELDYPEFYDVKLTDVCNGQCPYCYQSSKVVGNHAENIVEKIEKYFGNMTENQKPYQIACLYKNTLVGTPNGMRPIKELNIGDKVYDQNLKEVAIVNKVESVKPVVEIKGTKGFNVISTEDHLFLTENGLKEAKDLLGQQLVTSTNTNLNSHRYISEIDLAYYINKSSQITGQRGGSGGGIVKENTIAFMHTGSLIPRYLKLDLDIVWLYGLSVAEGYKRGLGLHVDEIAYRDKANIIYKKITNLTKDVSVYQHPDSKGVNVEFPEPKNYNTIFFDAMKIGWGAKNKSISFLFNVSDDLVKSALLGMFDGDGCYRERFDKRNQRYYYSASYKTASRTLAYELVYLLHVRFNIKASLVYGWNKKRKIQGRVLEKSEYFSVEIYSHADLKMLFSDRFSQYVHFNEVGNTLYSSNKTKDFIKVTKISKIKKLKTVYDITLEEGSSHLFSISHGVVTHNCGGGEPTLHPQFSEIMKTTFNLGIAPNYTTNGTFVRDVKKLNEVVKTTVDYCEGVAFSCHPHLENDWKLGAEIFVQNDIFTNFHNIISDKESIETFIDIYLQWKDDIKYFVLLPLMAHGRATESFNQKVWDYLIKAFDKNNIEHNKIAFGANFYPYLVKDKDSHNFKVDLYEPEILSKYIDFVNMKMYSSSFSDKVIKEIE